MGFMNNLLYFSVELILVLMDLGMSWRISKISGTRIVCNHTVIYKAIKLFVCRKVCAVENKKVGKVYSGLEIMEYNPSIEIVEFVVLLAVYLHASNGYD